MYFSLLCSLILALLGFVHPYDVNPSVKTIVNGVTFSQKLNVN